MSITPGKSIVAILSGGLDSTTMVYEALDDDIEVPIAVSFNYGQRHKKELDHAKRTCGKLGIEHIVIDLWSSGLTEALSPSESVLVTGGEVPEGHYGEETMKATVVPNRNMIMISIAGGIAVAEGVQGIGVGMHAGDHFIYPDCRPDFLMYAATALSYGNEGFGDLHPTHPIYAPYVYKTKEHIALQALELGVPLEDTWSCYKGGNIHCGKCGTCVERLEAIEGAFYRYKEMHGVWPMQDDLTEYEDKNFWREAIKRETV